METYWHWLCSVLAAEPGLQGKLLKRYKTPKAIFAAEAEELEEQFPRSRSRIGELCRSRAGWDFEKEQRILRQKGIRFVSREHPDFPGRLLDIPDSPGGLFVKGRLPGEGAAVALVGARDCSAYGRNTALWFGRELAASGVQIISGMARGIDGQGQRGALQGGGETFAVLGSGVDVCYPVQNRELYLRLEKEGGLLSESPPGTPPLKHLFPLRNRLISGLSDAVLVIEAREKSGSLITADFALEQGKDVYAVPGRLQEALSGGCHNLIRQGAGLAVSPKQLLEDLQLFPENRSLKKEKSKMALESSENLVYSCLSLQAVNLDAVCSETQLPPQEVSGILTRLVLKGYVREIYKNYYTRVS